MTLKVRCGFNLPFGDNTFVKIEYLKPPRGGLHYIVLNKNWKQVYITVTSPRMTFTTT